jgi:hypothetical protein
LSLFISDKIEKKKQKAHWKIIKEKGERQG